MATVIDRSPSAVVSARVGYLVAVVVNLVMWYVINIQPGWQAVPFLTQETTLVLPFVNASIIAAIGVNLLYVFRDPAWLRGLGDVVATTLGLVAMVRIWQVFPVDFVDGSLWRLLARWVVAVGIVGSVIGIVAAFSKLVRGLTGRHRIAYEGRHPTKETA